ncbi:MAG: hypothetical protein QXK37_05820 [Candidatus Woesearchaeota archaeon]
MIIQVLPPWGACKGDEVSIETGKVCFNKESKRIKIFINNRDIVVTGFRVDVVGKKGVSPSTDIEKLVKVEQPVDISVPYDESTYGDIESISIVAMLNKSNNIKECPIKQKVTMVKPCS